MLKNKIYSGLSVAILAGSLLMGSGVAEAAYSCRWVPAHWSHGVRVAGHKVCWNRPGYGARCRWAGGYWRHGYWHRGHRVCW